MKKVTKIGINGFGRIGRLAARLSFDFDEVEVVGINDPFVDVNYAKYLLEHDTIFGKFNKEVKVDGEYLVIGKTKIRFFGILNPEEIDWKSCGAEIILECTGKFTKYDDAKKHLFGGAKKVIVSAPGKEMPMFVYGVNEKKYKKDMDVISNASCTTNCLAPLVKIIYDTFGIEEGLMSTVHSTTATQLTVDGPSKKDWRGGRAASGNIIPASTGAAKAVGEVIPEVKGKLTGMSFRVPTLDVSVVDLTVRLKTPTNYEEIKKAVKKASQTYLKGVFGYTEDMVVSSDFIGDTHGGVFDANAGIMLSDTFVKLVAWYDNEMGYTMQLLRMASYIANK